MLNIDNLRNDDGYDKLSIELESLVSNVDKRVYAIFEVNGDNTLMEINAYEASMLSFVYKGLHLNSHIQTIHQIFVKYLLQSSMTIEEVVIESKVGDVIYCTAKILDNKHDRTFTVLSLVDGLILSLISKAPIFVIKNVWEQMEEFDEDWDYEDFIVDFENEDDDDED